jgi:hypothetical protein
MTITKCILTGLTAIAAVGMASEAMADGRNPGSLLLYPEFDNRYGTVTVVTVTNTDAAGGDVDVEFVYIGRYGEEYTDIDCEEFNRTETLTANDTLTLLTDAHNPQHEQGYLYVFARDGVNSPIAHNWLIGSTLTVEGLESFEYSVNPVSYAGLAPGVANNGLRRLDGNQYEQAADEILVPRFLGQSSGGGHSGDGGHFRSQLILIGLTGGAAFDTTVDFLIYNDNEEEYSAEHTFYCWDRVYLGAISGIFENDFLRDFTNQDPGEILGSPTHESGWFRMTGAQASSSSTTIANPAVYGVLVERVGDKGASDLPFEAGSNANGALLARSLDGSF